jgi:transcriptional regulator with XRE-family HTH domain
MNRPIQLGAVIRRWRITSDLSLKEVAKDMGISLPTLSRLEHGHEIDGRTLLSVINWLMAKERAA